jgi:hypothetical protein
LASSINQANDLITEVHRFSIDTTNHTATGLTYQARTDINCPRPNICDTYSCNLGFTSAITSMIENPEDGNLYATGFTAPRFPAEANLPYHLIGKEIFTTPMLAALSPDSNQPLQAAALTGCDLVLPFSMLWTGPAQNDCGGADFEPDGDVDWDDLAVLTYYWLESNCAAFSNCGGADLEPADQPDDDVDIKDFAVLARYWLETGCLENP